MFLHITLKMNKKIFCFIIVVICSISSPIYSQGVWEKIYSPTDENLKSVFFVDSLYGWAAGDSGIIINTTNGGTNWSIQNSNTSDNIVEIFFVNRSIGWASSWSTTAPPFGTILLKTTDGGVNWNQIPYPTENIFITCILFTDSLTGWMGGKPHALVKSTDGGFNWQQAEIDTSILAFLPVLNIKFYNSEYGYACGGAFENAGVIWNTTNGGNKWFAIDHSFAPPDPIQQIHLFDSLHVIGSSGDREVYGVGMIRTTDGGNFWEYENAGIPGVAYDLEFRTDYNAWATLGSIESLIYSLDSGATWSQIPTPDSTTIFDITFPDSLHGYAVGQNGAIIKYKPEIINYIENDITSTPSDFRLLQNYPNPFNPSTKIKFKISKSPLLGGDGRGGLQYVKLVIYDILGNEVTTLVNEELPAGNYEVEFDGSNLPSGVYFYRLQAGTFVSSKKMILLR